MASSDRDTTPDGPNRISAKVRTALARFKLAVEATSKQRQREYEDLSFQVPEMQWADETRNERTGTVIDGVPVPARPMLSISKINQPIKLITNQERAAHLGVQISALDSDADDETAEVLADIYRGIERDSRAPIVRSWAFDRAVKCGFGVYRIHTEYDETSSVPTDQKIVIKRILNQASVYLDPFAEEPDWSDGQWAMIVHDMPWDRYKAEFPKSKLEGMDDSEFISLLTEQPGWVNGDKASRVVRVVEYFYLEFGTETHYDYGEGTIDDAQYGELPEEARKGLKVARERQIPTVHYCKINAVEELKGTATTLPGRYIPIIPMIGEELQPFDAQRRFYGVIRPAMDAQRMFNWAASKTVEDMAAQPVSPWVMAEGQEEGHEAEWSQANKRRFPYLRYKPTTVAGQLAPPPERSSTSTDLSSNLALLQSADEWIQSTTFTPDPSLGNLNSRDRSGKAIQALQQQSDIGNSNYIQNEKDISVLHESRVVLPWIAVYYGRPGRLVRTVKADDTEAPVMVNQPFVMDPKTKRPLPVDRNQLPPGVQPDQVKHYDLKKGIYGVAVTVGKSFATGRKEGANALGEMITAVPASFGVVGDLWAHNQDWPGHEEVAKRLKKMLPPQAQDKDESGQPSVEQLQQQIQQMQQAGQQLQQQAGQMKQMLDTDQAKQAASVQIAQAKEASAVEIKKAELAHAREIESLKLKYSLEETRTKAQAQVAVEQIKSGFANARAQFDAEMADERSAADREHEAGEADAGRLHDVMLTQAEREAQSVEADAARQAEMAEAERGRGFEAEQAEAGRMAEAEAAEAAAQQEPSA